MSNPYNIAILTFVSKAGRACEVDHYVRWTPSFNQKYECGLEPERLASY
jgi:hypothetical protein